MIDACAKCLIRRSPRSRTTVVRFERVEQRITRLSITSLRLEPRVLQDVHSERDVRTRFKRLSDGHMELREMRAIELRESQVDIAAFSDTPFRVSDCCLGRGKVRSGAVVVVYRPP